MLKLLAMHVSRYIKQRVVFLHKWDMQGLVHLELTLLQALFTVLCCLLAKNDPCVAHRKSRYVVSLLR